MKTRLVITGMGAVTPIGIGVSQFWRNLVAGECGIGEITRFDASGLPTRIAAEIHDFDGQEHLPRTVTRSAAPFMQFAFAAGAEAIKQAHLQPEENPERIGICMGTALAGATEIYNQTEEYLQSATGKISPHFVPRTIANMAAAHIAISHGFLGPSFTLSTACSAGGDAIMSAALLILAGEADAMLALAGESALCPPILSSLAQAKALSRRNDEPKKASRPFDKERDGFVIGEGGGALVIESEEHAKKRGAKILAELAGFANTMDGWHITAPDPQGAGAARCMANALAKAGLQSSAIDYINAHGTSTQLGDHAETLAIKEIFGKAAPPVSSSKGATGHLMGAGALIETIACVKAIETGILPPTINLENPDPECDLDYIPNIARQRDINIAMSNSLGFGGQNSSIIVKGVN